MERINDLPRIICVGSNLESEIALRGLIKAKVNIVALVTRPAGNDQATSDYRDLHSLCKENAIQTIDTVDINSEKVLEEIKSFSSDYIFTLGWNQLFQEPLLQLPKKFVIGSHPSLLPFGRGRAPVPWTILQGLKESAITFFKMNIEIDAGEILLQKKFPIPENCYAYELYSLIAENLKDGFIELYESFIRGIIPKTPSTNIQPTYRAKRSPEDGLIDFNQTSDQISRLIRAVSYPFPGAYFYYKDNIYRVWKCSADTPKNHFGVIGQILFREGNKVYVQANDAPICFEEITDNNKNEVSANTFKIGSKIGYRIEDELYALKKEILELKNKIQPDDKNE